jgi:hypothetical protein
MERDFLMMFAAALASPVQVNVSFVEHVGRSVD